MFEGNGSLYNTFSVDIDKTNSQVFSATNCHQHLTVSRCRSHFMNVVFSERLGATKVCGLSSMAVSVVSW